MRVLVKRVYEPREKRDGSRVLVDRIWPRGLSQRTAGIDYWLKEIAPSTRLRKWFAHDPRKWPEFKKRYYRELKKNPESVRWLRKLARNGTVTLLFAAKDVDFNNAMALKQYLKR